MILRLYLSNFTSEHTAELGLGQGIRMLGWVGTKLSFVEIKAKFRINLPRCWYTLLCPSSLSCWWLSAALSPQLAEHDPTVMYEVGQSDRDVHGRLLENNTARQAKLRAFIEGNENSLKVER